MEFWCERMAALLATILRCNSPSAINGLIVDENY
jgi:hypothetical protein